MNASLEALDGETMEDFLNNVPDILISAYLIVGIFVALALFVFAFLIFRAVLGVIKSVGRVVNNVERASDVAVDRIVTPLEEGLSFAAAAGNAVGFATSFLSGLTVKSTKKQSDKSGKGKGESKKKQEWG